MELNFGIVGADATERKLAATAPFRLAVLGDFSAGANRGRLETGDDLANRKPMRVDVDNLDKMIERLKINVALEIAGEGLVEFPITSMDDFHPDQIFDNVELFEALKDLQQKAKSKTGFPAVAKDMVAWRAEPAAKGSGRARGGGVVIPPGESLSDFALLIGMEPEEKPKADIDALLKEIVRPHIVKAKDPQQAALIQSIEKARAVAMRKILHHPDFQLLESIWRSVDMLTRRLETSQQLQIVLYDISAEEFAADLATAEDLTETGLYKLLIEAPAVDAGQGALSAFIGAYQFDKTVTHAELLGRIAKLCALAGAPFISSISPVFLDTPVEDVEPDIRAAWEGLCALDEASYVALITPRHLLRQPYGERTDPVDCIDDFEEFTRTSGLKGMLWGNPAFLAGMMLAQTYAKQGAKMNLGSILTADDIPVYFFIDDDDDQIALPATERLITEAVSVKINNEHFIPMVSIKGRPEVRLGGFKSLAGTPLEGRWPSPAGASKPKDGEELPAEKPKAKKPPAEKAAAPKPKPPKPAAPPPPKEEDQDLDALLAGLSSDTNETGEGEMDPELAELLKGL